MCENGTYNVRNQVLYEIGVKLKFHFCWPWKTYVLTQFSSIHKSLTILSKDPTISTRTDCSTNKMGPEW